ncbi:DUF2971 domain-containing protein [Colwelliaceae bacterium 6441]
MTDCFYHYTDAQTALKILTKKELWMTHTSFLNDTQEGKELRIYLNKALLNPEICKILDYIDSNFESYICSFSKNGDLLSQWRGYCPDGEGYSIGFHQPKSFKTLLNPEGEACFRGEEKPNVDSSHATWHVSNYEKCIYLDEEKEKICESLVQDMENSYANMPDNIRKIVSELPKTPQELKDLYNYLSNVNVWFKLYIYYSCLFKDESFQEEDEYRLFITFNNRYKQEPCYRVKKGIFIPYHRFCFEDKLFKEIIVRKTSHDEFADKGLRHYLKHHKKMTNEQIDIFIKPSGIPFRG